jgi:uncharacterized protein YjlB
LIARKRDERWGHRVRECPSAEHERALRTIPKVRLPAKDPVYGADGPLLDFWK